MIKHRSVLNWMSAGLFVCLMFVSTSAHAVTLNCVGSNSGQKLDATLDTALSGICVTGDNDDGNGGFFASNPTVFGTDGWIKADKDDESGNAGPIMFTQSVGVGTKSGTWGVNDYFGLTNVAIALKAGNSFGLFLLDTDFLSGTWSTSKDLSHATIWYQGTPVMAPVPVPASLPLLAGSMVLAGLVHMRRRKL